MKKLLLVTLTLFITGFISVSALGYYKFNYTQDAIYNQMADEAVASASRYTDMLDEVHPSWDQNHDGINDCEIDFSCDDTIDYSQPFEYIVEP